MNELKKENCFCLMGCKATDDNNFCATLSLLPNHHKSQQMQRRIHRRLLSKYNTNTNIFSVVALINIIFWTSMSCATFLSVSALSPLRARGEKMISATNHHIFRRRRESGMPSSFYRDPSVFSYWKQQQSRMVVSSSTDSCGIQIAASLTDTGTSTTGFSPRLVEFSERIFSCTLPEGRCVGLSFKDSLTLEILSSSSVDENNENNNTLEKHWIYDLLHPKEIEYGLGLKNDRNRHTFFLGRLAMREALRIEHNIIANDPILKDEHKRPRIPKGYLGSISHKDTIGVALVAVNDNEDNDSTSSLMLPSSEKTQQPKLGIGIDIERTATGRPSVAKYILTKQEIDELGQIEGMTNDEETLLRFSLKESLYKAMHPLICQYVGFQEAEVTPHANGTATFRLNIKTGVHEQFGPITAHWRRLDCSEFFLTSVSVQKLQPL
mmetsp:Transcript_25251/g.35607  ORF Transcript_25251/g.35607 Transcript_25251/m.35607 type:complete len:437 (+) Transcript_25251:320-1630(+)